MDHNFFGRKQELHLLSNLNSRERAQFLVLYGRRRIGKTYLIRHWLKHAIDHPNVLYWMATQTSTTRQLRDFSQTLFRFSNPDAYVAPDFSYQSWETALAQVGQLAQEKRFILVLDEFTYVMQANPEVPSILQKLWDQQLQNSQLFLILTGSLAGIIERATLDYKAPLYGRATGRIKLKPLPFGALSQFFPNMTTEQRIAIYTVAGGIPAYLNLFSDRLNIRENIEENLVSPANVMASDAIFLLREQFDDPKNYMAVIEAIANGSHRLTEISKMAGIPTNHLTKYLKLLKDLGYVDRLVPATVRRPEQSKKGRYVITDPYLRFYFRFLRPYMSEIEYGRTRPVVDLLETHLVDFIGTHTFEELCREWVHIKVDLGEFPFLPETVGSFWSKEAQCDVVATSWRSKQILLGECKWGQTAQGLKMVETHLEKTDLIVPKDGDWQVHHAFFSRNPLTEPAQARAKEAGAILVSPQMIEDDIVRWMNLEG
ncbi:MAG: AAA+ ATPase superfamily predicted ATPase [Cellvibrionaceae bacterium]|jgi:AAA+ ATPase superfamily predicted ATPase